MSRKRRGGKQTEAHTINVNQIDDIIWIKQCNNFLFRLAITSYCTNAMDVAEQMHQIYAMSAVLRTTQHWNHVKCTEVMS